MSSINKAIVIGNVGRDPEVRRTNSGDPVVSFSVATSDRWKDKETGEQKERTAWHNVVIFNEGLAKVAEQYVKKGSRLYIEGAMLTREYTDKDGNQRRVTEIVLQKFRGELALLDKAERQAPDANQYGDVRKRDPVGAGPIQPGPDDESIPFAPEMR